MRREVQVCYGMLRNVLYWLHECCMGYVLGRKPEHETLRFPCKVAAGDDERYLVCAAVAAGVGLPFFLPHCNGGFKLLWVCLCVRSYRVFGICACRSHWNGCMTLVIWCSGVVLCVDRCRFAS